MNPQLVYILNTLHRAKSKRIIEQLKQVTEEHDDDREQNSFSSTGQQNGLGLFSQEKMQCRR